VDGFRFDLMALHDVQTMQAAEAAVHAVNPKAIIYGEGWTGGETTLMPPLQATQANIKQVKASEGAIGAVAVFNDAIRDGLKGSVFNAKEQGYISGNVSKGTAWQVVFGLTGGQKNLMVSWSVDDNAVINYMACHDNHTIWDKLLASNPEDSDEVRFEMERLGISAILLGKGVPFFLAGDEILRTKGGDHNSYKSSDAVNNIDWDSYTDGSLQQRMHDLYRDLILLRKQNDFLTKADISCEILEQNVIMIVYELDGETAATAFLNPNDEAVSCALPEGDWGILFSVEAWDPDHSQSVSGSVEVPAKAAVLLVP
jgi:pullulanase